MNVPNYIDQMNPNDPFQWLYPREIPSMILNMTKPNVRPTSDITDLSSMFETSHETTIFEASKNIVNPTKIPPKNTIVQSFFKVSSHKTTIFSGPKLPWSPGAGQRRRHHRPRRLRCGERAAAKHGEAGLASDGGAQKLWHVQRPEVLSSNL